MATKQDRTISLKIWDGRKGAGLLSIRVGDDETAYRVVKQSPGKFKVSKIELDTGREHEPYSVHTEARRCTCMSFRSSKAKVKTCRHVDGLAALAAKERI